MAISRIGAAAAEATSITIPGTYQAADLMIIFAFRSGNATPPSLPAGWTNISSTAGTSSLRCGYKIAGSASETSGTWTNATGVISHVYRGTATNKPPVILGAQTAQTSADIIWQAMVANSLKATKSQWIAFFVGHPQINNAIETPPLSVTNLTDNVGAVSELASFDSNSAYPSSTYASQSITGGGTSGAYGLAQLVIFAEEGLPKNYQFVKVGDGMSTGEKIR